MIQRIRTPYEYAKAAGAREASRAKRLEGPSNAAFIAAPKL